MYFNLLCSRAETSPKQARVWERQSDLDYKIGLKKALLKHLILPAALLAILGNQPLPLAQEKG